MPKRRILPKSASGERLIAYSQSEPAGAANISQHLTKLEPEGNGYRLDGAKLFCTQSTAKTYLVMCKTRNHEGKEGYGCIIVEQEADGFLRIVDRKKDMIITGGFNVYAREVEDVIVEQAGVQQAAVIGVPDPKWGETAKAIVVLEPGATVTAEDIIAAVRARKGAVQAPKSVEFIDAIPVTSVGKPDKKALRVKFAA
ncbi:MAG: hypothetical protein ABIS10_12055 [Novosphingobium sp.]